MVVCPTLNFPFRPEMNTEKLSSLLLSYATFVRPKDSRLLLLLFQISLVAKFFFILCLLLSLGYPPASVLRLSPFSKPNFHFISFQQLTVGAAFVARDLSFLLVNQALATSIGLSRQALVRQNMDWYFVEAATSPTSWKVTYSSSHSILSQMCSHLNSLGWNRSCYVRFCQTRHHASRHAYCPTNTPSPVTSFLLISRASWLFPNLQSHTHTQEYGWKRFLSQTRKAVPSACISSSWNHDHILRHCNPSNAHTESLQFPRALVILTCALFAGCVATTRS